MLIREDCPGEEREAPFIMPSHSTFSLFLKSTSSQVQGGDGEARETYFYSFHQEQEICLTKKVGSSHDYSDFYRALQNEKAVSGRKVSWLCLYQREKQGNHNISSFQAETHIP